MSRPRMNKIRASTAEWRSIYPWHFDRSLPSTGPILGLDRLSGGAPFGLDPFGLVDAGLAANPNIAISGAPGNGKSALVKQLLWWLVGTFGYRMVITDVKSEYRALAEALNTPVLDLHPGGTDHVNPLDDAAGSLEFTRGLASLCVERSLAPIESAVLAAAMRSLPQQPELTDLLSILRVMPSAVLDELGVPSRDEALRDTQALRYGLGELLHGSLAGMFCGRTNVDLTTSPRGFVVDLSKCGTDTRALRFAMLAGTRATDQLIATSAGRTLAVNDEAWLLCATGETVRWLQHSQKLGRNRGQANIIVVHRFAEVGHQADGPTGRIADWLIADADTHIMFRAGSQDDAHETVARFGLPTSLEGSLATLPPHRCLIRVRGRLALLDTMLSTAMASLADTNSAMRLNAAW